MTKIIKDKSEFKMVFEEYYLPLCHFMKTFTTENALIEDVVQDVFVKLWKRRNEIEIKNLKSYLFTSVRNVFLDYKKKENRRKKYIAEYDKDELSFTPQMKELSENLILKQRIYNSLRHLPPKTRNIFELSKLKGLSYVEIASFLNVSTKTVEAHMTKAFKLIRENWVYEND